MKLTSRIPVTAVLLALTLGIAIAYTTAKGITGPLKNLMKIARQIGDAGDLDHEIDSPRADEIGQLAGTFGNMVTYLREMASV